MSTACGISEDPNHVVLCIENCSGVNSADGRMSKPDERERLGGIRAVRDGRSSAPTNGRNGSAKHAREAQDEPAVEQVVHVRACRSGRATPARRVLKSPKPSAQNATITVRIVRILLQSRERGLHRDRRGLLVLDHLAEHVVLLELPAGRFLHEEREDGDDDHRDPEQEQRPAPALRRRRPSVAMAATSTG